MNLFGFFLRNKIGFINENDIRELNLIIKQIDNRSLVFLSHSLPTVIE